MTPLPKGPKICGLPPAQFYALPKEEQERLKAIEHEQVKAAQEKLKNQGTL